MTTEPIENTSTGRIPRHHPGAGLKYTQAARIGRLLIALLGLWVGLRSAAARFELQNASLRDIQAAMDSGALTTEKLVRLYLERIEAYDARSCTSTPTRWRPPGDSTRNAVPRDHGAPSMACQ